MSRYEVLKDSSTKHLGKTFDSLVFYLVLIPLIIRFFLSLPVFTYILLRAIQGFVGLCKVLLA